MIWIFLFTSVVTGLNILVYISALCNHPFSPPYYKHLDVKSWWLFYPCLFHQAYFWIDKSGLF